MKILVTGSNGQLGQCIKRVESDYPGLRFFFANSKQLDITKKDILEHYFQKDSFDYIINCAAYTNVEQAEKEPEKAFLVNVDGVKNLAEICKKNDTTLIHVSTDYVFDGKKLIPYVEEDIPNPINEYGKSKLAGERYIQEILDKYFIVRTSWLYSQYGKNFYKTILKKSKTEEKLTIITSEIGTPTNANDLTKFLLELIKIKTKKYGMYHFSNIGKATWYDFAKEILELSGKLDRINLKKIDNYPTFAKRPKYSVLSKNKITKIFNIRILDWKKSLSLINDD